MRSSVMVSIELSAAKQQVEAWRQKVTRLQAELEAAYQAEREAADELLPTVRVIRGKQTVTTRVRSVGDVIRLGHGGAELSAIFARDGKAALKENGRIHPDDLKRILGGAT